MAKWKGAEILTELGGPQGECCFCTALYPHLWNEEWGLDNGSQTVHWAPLEVHLSLRALGSPLHILSHSPFIRLCGFHKKVHSWQKIFETPPGSQRFLLASKTRMSKPKCFKNLLFKDPTFYLGWPCIKVTAESLHLFQINRYLFESELCKAQL